MGEEGKERGEGNGVRKGEGGRRKDQLSPLPFNLGYASGGSTGSGGQLTPT